MNHDDTAVAYLVEVLGSLPTASPSLDQVGLAVGIDNDPLHDLLEAAEGAGLIEPWEVDGVLRIALTPVAAEQAGLVIVEVEGPEGYAWRSIGEPEPNPRVRAERGVKPASVAAGLGEEITFLDSFPDPGPSPVVIVDWALRMEARRSAGVGIVPTSFGEPLLRPIHLAGLGDPWQTAAPEAVCSGCRGKPLRFYGYCTKCDRVGFQHLLPELPRKVLRAMRGRSGDLGERSGDLAGGTGQAKTRGKGPGLAPGDSKRSKRKGVAAKAGNAKAGV